MRDHVIVCGFGRNGYKAYDELRHSGTRAVVVEQSQALLTAAAEAVGHQIPAVLGDATTETTLRQAGIERARALITALPKDADNVFVALTARELNPQLVIIARASARSSVSKLLSAGANSVVLPDEIGGSHMANLIIRPEVIRFLDMISGLDPNKLRLEELPYHELKPALRGQSIRELDVRSRTGATIIALRRGQGGELEVSPAADYRTAAGDVLLVLGNEAQIRALHQQVEQNVKRDEHPAHVGERVHLAKAHRRGRDNRHVEGIDERVVFEQHEAAHAHREAEGQQAQGQPQARKVYLLKHVGCGACPRPSVGNLYVGSYGANAGRGQAPHPTHYGPPRCRAAGRAGRRAW